MRKNSPKTATEGPKLALILALATTVIGGGALAHGLSARPDAATRLPAAFQSPGRLRAGDAPRGLSQLLPAVIHFYAETPECATRRCEVPLCTGTFISSEGHLLTALHCLENTGIFSDETWREVGLTSHVVDPGLLKTHPFRLRVQSSSESWGSPIQARITATGQGFRSPFNQLLASRLDPERYRHVIDRDLATLNDFVILKLTLNSASPCAPTAPVEAEPPGNVWSLSYPARTERHDNMDSPGRVQLYSEGKVTRGVSENEALAQMLAPLTRENRESVLGIYHHAMDREGSFASTLDMGPGSSGGPVFNPDGHLVGMLTSLEVFQGDPLTKFYPGIARAVSVNRIQQGLRSSGKDRLFRCQAAGAPIEAAGKRHDAG